MFTETRKQADETAPVRKFMFERSFDDASVVHRVERKPVLMKPEQIDAMKQEARDAGFAEGQAAARDAQAAALAATLETVGANVAALVQKLADLAQEQEKNARLIALAAAKKVVPEFAARNGMQEIEAVVAEAIRDMAREPRLVVRIHESQFDAVNARVQEIAAQRAFSGKVIVLADADVASGDCRVEWADGGVERNTRATWNALETTINPTA